MNHEDTKPPTCDISAVVCTYTQERWEDLVSAISSLKRQQCRLREIIVVVDHNDVLLQRVRSNISGVLAIANEGPKGLSGARNTGAAAAVGTVVASLDDDAEAEPDWSAHVSGCFADPTVVAVGCAILPAWERPSPRWFPEEFLWVVGCTYRGVPTDKRAIRNPLGAAMAIRREALESVGGFRSDLGRLDKKPFGCEETELCVRLAQLNPAALLIQEPAARVAHRVPMDRATWSYFRRRCFAEGRSKAAVSRVVGASDGLRTERSYLLRTLPSGVWHGFLATLRGDPAGSLRAAAIIAGLGWTIAGFLAGRLPTSFRLMERLDTSVEEQIV